MKFKDSAFELSNIFTTLENFDDNKDISRAGENIEENDKFKANESLGYYELKEHKSLCAEEYS
jgi:hypothetical protein